MPLDRTHQLQASPGQPPHWQSEALYQTAESYFQGLLADINAAAESITLETFIFRSDNIGQQIIEALIRAQDRGVKVRVLIDGIGSSEHCIRIIEQLKKGGVEVRIFHPLPWNFSAYSYSNRQDNWLLRWFFLARTINRRNHRKLCVIDQKTAWIGSFNITDDHFGGKQLDKDHKTKSWKDLAARVTGKDVAKLQQSFDHIWHRVIDRANYRKRLRRFFSNHTRQLRKEKNRQMLQQLRRARERVWICNAYFSPSNAFLKALKIAHNRGVSVRIIVPEKSDVFLFPALSSTYYADCLKNGIRVYEYHQAVLHEKSMLIDNTAIVGSTNLNYRSWLHDLELDVLLNGESTIKQLEMNFIEDLKHCTEITAPRLQHYPKLLLALGWISRIFRYWV